MPRQSRTKSESGIYHVMFRGNNQQVIFEDDFDRMKFISLLSEFQENEGRGCFTLYSYCLMTNHVHLLYREMGDDVQRSMKRIVGVLRGHHVACDQIARATGLSYDQVNRIFRRLEVEEKKEVD